jgi:hypothetical protein
LKFSSGTLCTIRPLSRAGDLWTDLEKLTDCDSLVLF